MTRILVVDDERGAAEALARLLRLDGFEAVGFSSPVDARAAIESQPFDAVVTDLEMPRVHGVDIVRSARKAQACAPVFVVSAYNESTVARTAVESGATRVFSKPLDYDELLGAIRAAFVAKGPP